MSKLIYIKANPKSEGNSNTLKISDAFVKDYKENHPQDEIITLDLYKENIGFLTEYAVEHHNIDHGEDTNHPIFKYAYQFLEADKIVMAAPFWNLSFPAILKAYLDYVTVSGITFKYTSEGPVGLCQGKKALHIVTRGGNYSEEPFSSFELGDKYLRTLFSFLGFSEFVTIAVEDMNRSSTDIDLVISDAINKAKNIVKTF